MQIEVALNAPNQSGQSVFTPRFFPVECIRIGRDESTGLAYVIDRTGSSGIGGSGDVRYATLEEYSVVRQRLADAKLAVPMSQADWTAAQNRAGG